MMFKANVTASLTTESRSWITERRPPAKFAHGNYRRADWFEYRFGQLLALCDEAFLWNSPAEFDEWKARVDALAQGKLTWQKFTLEEIQEADENMTGFCIECGEPRDNCEPDARGYPCDACGQLTVYGAQEILIMELIE